MKLSLLVITLSVIIFSIKAEDITSRTNISNSHSNYNNNINGLNRLLSRPNHFRGEGLVKSEFISSKVKVVLSCEPEETVIHLNFTEPFRGVALAGGAQSPCRVRGDGRVSYVLRVPHNSCHTQHVISKGSFVNTLFIRFHPSLEMGGDHSKTIVCNFGIGSIDVS